MRSRPELTHEDCVKISAAAMAEARKNSWNVAIAILDDGGRGLIARRLEAKHAHGLLHRRQHGADLRGK